MPRIFLTWREKAVGEVVFGAFAEVTEKELEALREGRLNPHEATDFEAALLDFEPDPSSDPAEPLDLTIQPTAD